MPNQHNGALSCGAVRRECRECARVSRLYQASAVGSFSVQTSNPVKFSDARAHCLTPNRGPTFILCYVNARARFTPLRSGAALSLKPNGGKNESRLDTFGPSSLIRFGPLIQGPEEPGCHGLCALSHSRASGRIARRNGGGHHCQHSHQWSPLPSSIVIQACLSPQVLTLLSSISMEKEVVRRSAADGAARPRACSECTSAHCVEDARSRCSHDYR